MAWLEEERHVMIKSKRSAENAGPAGLNKIHLIYNKMRGMRARRSLIKIYLTYIEIWLTYYYYELGLMRMRALRARRGFGAYLCSNGIYRNTYRHK